MRDRRKDSGYQALVRRLFEAVEIQDFSISPDGRTAVCSINRGKNWELATLNLRTGALRTLRRDCQSLVSPVHSPDGKRVAFLSDFEGNEDHDVYELDLQTNKVRRVTDGISDNKDATYSPDGSQIAFVSNRDRDIENVFVVRANGGKPKQLTEESLPVRSVSWSPDGLHIAYVVGIFYDDYVSMVDVKTGKVRKLLAKKGVDYGTPTEYGSAYNPWSADGSKILFTSNESGDFDIGELNIASGKRRWLARSPHEKASPQWSPDGRSLSYVEVLDPNVVVRVKTGAKTSTVSPADGTSRMVRWLPDGSGLAFINGAATRPDELFITKGTRALKITKLMPRPFPAGALASPRLVRFRSTDGRKIAGILFEPKDRSRRAGIVMPHGGPDAQSVNAWDQLVQMFVAKGFSVLEPNYRGSTGYGREFERLNYKDMGGGDLQDVLAAGRYMVREGYAAKDRLGFWGASYGGFLCMLALTKEPEMWAAGVSVVGFFDWETEMATERGFLKAYDQTKMGRFEDDPEFFRERSPIYFLDRLRAPVLLTASSKDIRCPPTEARQVVARLKELGKEHQYHEYSDEGHWPRKRKNLKDLFVRSVKFLDENIPK